MSWRRMDSLKEQSKLSVARPLPTKRHSRTRQILEPLTKQLTKTKTEIALDYIYDLPDFPLPIRKLTPIGKMYEVAKLLAAGLVVKDPLNLIDD
jgi:hypothetical protein